MAKDIIVERAFDNRPLDKAHVLARYAAHNAEVQRSVPAGRLLTYDVAEGWEPLCRFLGVPVPDTPFPSRQPARRVPPRPGPPARLKRA